MNPFCAPSRTTPNAVSDSFARTYGFSVSAVRDWEQGRRKPGGAARIPLAMIAHGPETVETAMGELWGNYCT